MSHTSQIPDTTSCPEALRAYRQFDYEAQQEIKLESIEQQYSYSLISSKKVFDLFVSSLLEEDRQFFDSPKILWPALLQVIRELYLATSGPTRKPPEARNHTEAQAKFICLLNNQIDRNIRQQAIQDLQEQEEEADWL